MKKNLTLTNSCGVFYKMHQTRHGEFYFFDKYVITEFKEGVTVNFDTTKDLCFLINKYYGDTQPFGLISNRKHSYAVFPTDYFYLNNMMFNLKGIAVVNHSVNKTHPKFDSEIIEKIICPRPYQSFNDLDLAKDWICSLVC